MNKTLLRCLGYSLLCLCVGFVSSRFQIASIENWYPYLEKPSITPPNIVFPIVWTILYICVGCSAGLLKRQQANFSILYIFFFLQLIANFTWSIVFFYFQNPLVGLVNIVILDVLVVFYIAIAWRSHKWSAALFSPYLLWLLLATYLNAYILVYN